MYGNTTPIKFIFCKKKIQSKSYTFRPYDLEKIKEKGAIKDYFIVTPSGITHVYDPDPNPNKEFDNSKEINLLF